MNNNELLLSNSYSVSYLDLLIKLFLAPTCRVETWGGELDDNNYQASINDNVIPGEIYYVDQYYNGIGSIDGVSAVRVVGDGCVISFSCAGCTAGQGCTLSAGDYPFDLFTRGRHCPNDVITQYRVYDYF